MASLKRPIHYILTPVNRLIATFLRLLRLSTLRSLLVIPSVRIIVVITQSTEEASVPRGRAAIMTMCRVPGTETRHIRCEPRPCDQGAGHCGHWSQVTRAHTVSRSPCHANTESEWENIKHTLAGHQSPCASVTASHVSDKGKRYTYLH